MKKSSLLTLTALSMGLISLGIPSAFAQVDMVGVDIFCDPNSLFGFVGVIPFLEICPIDGILPDADGDGIPDVDDVCDFEPETFNGFEDEDGCPDILPVIPSVSINDASAPEGNSNDRNELIFTVSLNAPSTSPILLDFTTEGISATPNVDYEELSGIITFLPGEQAKNIIIILIGDTRFEADETFEVQLSNCNNCIISDGIGIGTIPAGNESLSLAGKAVFQGWSDEWAAVGNTSLFFGASDTLHVFYHTGALCAFSLLAEDFPKSLAPCAPIIAEAAWFALPTSIESVTQKLADDPPDNNFQTVFQIPEFPTFEAIGESELQITSNSLLNALSKEEALLNAFLVSFERYQGAGLAGENEFVILQLSAVKTYSDLLYDNHLEIEELSRQYNILSQSNITEEKLNLLQYRLSSEGLDPTEVQNFLDVGYSLERIDEIKEVILLLDMDNIASLSEDYEEFSDSIMPVTDVFRQFSLDLEEFQITPQKLLESVISEVNDLHDEGILNNGNTNALTSKLNDAIDKILDGKNKPAINKIESFINQVEAFIGAGKLTLEQGQPLIDIAQSVIDDLK